MSTLPASIPRALDIDAFHADPFVFLAGARSALGDVVAVSDGTPIFSRDPDCAGAVAVFGPRCHRAVLSDIETFGMPVSAARTLSLPEPLGTLNAGLHSMRGDQHARHQRLLMAALGERTLDAHRDAVRAGLEACARRWAPGARIGLLAEMRQLAWQVSLRLLLGERYGERDALGALLDAYFHLRREAASRLATPDGGARDELIALGRDLDAALRRYIRACREHPGSADGLLGSLAAAGGLSEDELVAHGNVLFVSGNEPIAVALTWTLLILSGRPALRHALREEIARLADAGAVPSARELAELTLLGDVVNESLRLLPPNAFMARVTRRPVSLAGFSLPERCEIVVCPFLAHREPGRFPEPDAFRPSRWRTASPSPFEYFPFGAGGHHCVGRALATYLIEAALAFLLPRHDLVLAGDQEIDWRLHIIFMPRDEPIMRVDAPGGAGSRRPGRLLGPVGTLIRDDAGEPVP